jgi:predicted transcriptional regulator
MAEQPIDTNILGLTAKVVAALVSNNTVPPTEVQSLIRQVYKTLAEAGS